MAMPPRGRRLRGPHQRARRWPRERLGIAQPQGLQDVAQPADVRPHASCLGARSPDVTRRGDRDARYAYRAVGTADWRGAAAAEAARLKAEVRAVSGW